MDNGGHYVDISGGVTTKEQKIFVNK